MQAWPWLWKIAKAEPLTAAARSASSNTMLAPLPPSSSWTRLTLPADASTIRRPTSVEPVNAILRTPSWRARCSPTVRPGPGHDVHDPGREARLDHQLGDAQGAQRGQLGGLHDHRVAGREGRAHLPAAEHEREVPRHDHPDHAQRLAQDVVQEPGLDRDDIALDLVGHTAEVAEGRRGPRHVEVPAVADRVARVERLERGQLVGVGLDQVGEPKEQSPAGRGLRPGPRRERRGGGRDGTIDVGGCRPGRPPR